MREKFETLMENILYTIRIEIRCHVMYYLDLAIREGDYFSEEEQLDPDPYIGSLNVDLTQIEVVIIGALPPRQARF